MDDVTVYVHEEEGSNDVSYSDDFAEIYLFLANFGPYLNFPRINLIDLENFFRRVPWNDEDNDVVYIKWRLIRYTGKSGPKEDWQRMAVKYGRKVGLLTETIPYQEISVKIRLKIFRLLCEEQFDCNRILLNNLKRDTPGIITRPIGVDRDGLRYWLLQDPTFDIRYYSEGNYDETPPTTATWILLACTLDALADHISTLDSKTTPPTKSGNNTTSSLPVSSRDTSSPPPSPSPSSSPSSPPPSPRGSGTDGREVMTKRKRQSKRTATSRNVGGINVSPTHNEDNGNDAGGELGNDAGGELGCLKCCRDNDYDQLLLCDVCDRECHTYCQYPVLWAIPKGKWVCPICKEGNLVKELREVYLKLLQGKSHRDQQMQRKERSVARLQKSGLLVQNIILDDRDEGKRARRNRKAVNYAELNDIYLPPLGPRDVVGGSSRDSSLLQPSFSLRRKRAMDYYIQEDYLAPRPRNSSRRFKGQSHSLDTVEEEADCAVGRNDELRNISSDESSEKNVAIRSDLGVDSRLYGSASREGEGLGVLLLGKRSHDKLSDDDSASAEEDEVVSIQRIGSSCEESGSENNLSPRIKVGVSECMEGGGVYGCSLKEYSPTNTGVSAGYRPSHLSNSTHQTNSSPSP